MTVTDIARNKAKEFVEKQGLNLKDVFIRLSIKGGGCAGMTKGIAITNKSELTENDIVKLID